LGDYGGIHKTSLGNFGGESRRKKKFGGVGGMGGVMKKQNNGAKIMAKKGEALNWWGGESGEKRKKLGRCGIVEKPTRKKVRLRPEGITTKERFRRVVRGAA